MTQGHSRPVARVGRARRAAMRVPDEWPSQAARSGQNPAYRSSGALSRQNHRSYGAKPDAQNGTDRVKLATERERFVNRLLRTAAPRPFYSQKNNAGEVHRSRYILFDAHSTPCYPMPAHAMASPSHASQRKGGAAAAPPILVQGEPRNEASEARAGGPRPDDPIPRHPHQQAGR